MERSTAIKVRIYDIQEGQYIRASERGGPNYVLTPRGEKISRARIMGTVVAKYISEDEKYGSITIDDGSDTISVKAFRNEVKLIKKIEEGDIVDVVGKVKEYNGEKYITAECIATIEDPNWELVRKLELFLKYRESVKENKREGEIEIQEETIEESPKFIILNLIEELDDGQGVKYISLLEKSGFSEEKLESVLNELMQEGEIYEPKIGRFKKV